MKTISIVTVLNFLILCSVYSRDIKFKHLSGKDGLTSNMVNAILQDSDGFMWFGTKDGLCRYDGYTFLNFINSTIDSLTLSNNHISCLVEDDNHNLWIGTQNGLNVLNLETYEIKRISSDFKYENEVFRIQYLMVDDDNKLWVGTYDDGLYCVDFDNNDIINYTHSQTDTSSIISNSVFSILDLKERGILIATSNGLDILKPSTSTFKHILKDIDVRSLSPYQNSSVFVGIISDYNSYYILKSDGTLKMVPLPVSFSQKHILSLVDSEGNKWVSVRDNTLIYYEAQQNKPQQLLFDKSKTNGISSNAITSFYEDRLGNIWMGTYDAGINVLKKNSKPFIHIKDNNLTIGLQNNRVRSMYQDSDGDIWIGTKVYGTLSKFDCETSIFTHYKHNPLAASSISSDFIFCITEDRPDYLWVGTARGLNLFNKKNGESRTFLNKKGDKNSISSNSIYALLKDGDNLYIGHSLGMDIYDVERKTFSHFQRTERVNSLSDNKVRVIKKDSKGQIWVGTINGLNLFNKVNGTFTRFLNSPNDRSSISDNYINSIHEDEQHNLWIGTMAGLNLINQKDYTFEAFTIGNGLSSNSIYGILDDDHGNIWLSSNKGLSKLNPLNKKVKNYNVHDGLQANEFSRYVYCKTKDGKMLFGGNNGFNIFHPDQISDNENIPNVLLTDFKLANQSVKVGDHNSPLKKHISRSKEIALTYKQSIISFEYVALNYTSPENNQYAYKLEGFEKEWNYVGKKRDATYTNLSPGDYIFRVKASNNDGLWNEEGVSLKIKVIPPAWLTWWAYLFYFILIVSLFLLYRGYTIKRVQGEKENEQNHENLKFFINVSHEFRTPLTLILHPIQRILQSNSLEQSKEAAQNIHLSANKLMNLMNQLLDFRKIDLGRLPLRIVKVDVVGYSNKIFKLFEEIGYSKKLTLLFECSHSSIDIWLDPDKYEKILNNLLSNAIKYTPIGGQVVLSIAKKSSLIRNSTRSILNKKVSEDYVEIKVVDTGIGIAKGQFEHVFERFYSSDETPVGTGVGLHYSKSLIEMHGGDISVESTTDSGSTFIVQLPLGNQHLKEEQISKTEFNVNDYNLGMTHLESLKYDIDTTDDIINNELEEEQEKDVYRNSKLPIILLVEDNKRLRVQLKEALENKYLIKEAINGEEGWKKAKKCIPDLIISDIMMPEMDGNELCQKIKNGRRTCHIPVILLTAQINSDQKITSFENGTDQYITKPFNIDELHARIKNLLVQRDHLQKIFRQQIEVNPSEITVTSIDEQLIQKALDSVERNISNLNYSVDELSDELAMSRGHLYRKIVSITGNSPSDFIRAIRLKRSVQLLKSSQLTISEISYAVGFKDPKYFTKLFKAEFKTPPSLYVSEDSEDISPSI